MPQSFAMGETAGTATALALREGVLPRNVPVGWLRNTPREQGAYVGPDRYPSAPRAVGTDRT